MTEQEKQGRREKILGIFGLGANPTQRGSHIKCARCGKLLYAPMPERKLYESEGCMAFTVLIISYIFHRGWKVVKEGAFNGKYICPSCTLPNDELKLPIDSPKVKNALNKYLEWIKEMRAKFNYYEA